MGQVEITRKQMVEWLKKRRGDAEHELSNLGEIKRATNYFIARLYKEDIAVIDAILAALAERAEPVTEGERKELSKIFYYLIYRAGERTTWDRKIQRGIDKIRTLIMGKGGDDEKGED